jgi:hypothetical protein
MAAARMTGDASTLHPLVKEHTSNLYAQIKNNISSISVLGEASDDNLTRRVHLKSKDEIYTDHTC